MNTRSDHFGLNRKTIERCFQHYALLPWYDKVALALSTLLGLVLLVALSPLFFLVGMWSVFSRPLPRPKDSVEQPLPASLLRTYR